MDVYYYYYYYYHYYYHFIIIMDVKDCGFSISKHEMQYHMLETFWRKKRDRQNMIFL